MSLGRSLRLVLCPASSGGSAFHHRSASRWRWSAGILLGAWLFWLGTIFTLFCLYFFRDPKRIRPDRERLVLAPADGHIVSVMPAVPPEELGLGAAPRWRVAIFLSVIDVHVNRVPADGTVTRIAYRHGKYLNASLDKASDGQRAQRHRAAAAGWPRHGGGADRRADRPAHPVRHPRRRCGASPASASASSASAAAPMSTCRRACARWWRGPDHDRRRDGDRRPGTAPGGCCERGRPHAGPRGAELPRPAAPASGRGRGRATRARPSTG